MSDKVWWVVEASGELLGVTDDLSVAEKALQEQYAKDFPEVSEQVLSFDIKFMDWYLFAPVIRECLWHYSARRADEL